ncbi:MAG: exodeoxyribonuclease VII small subunit [Clostridia bacterium]|nr:exodeoxyribonuclease VII small subunit [Clostridia bacterium]
MATKKLKFEEALSRLEEVVSSLEAGNVELDKSLALYEEAMKLIRLCNDRLDAAEQKVEHIRLGEENGTAGEEKHDD